MTPFENIYDYALTVIEDYRLNKLASTNMAVFKKRMESYLVNAIPEFTGCMKSLDYTIGQSSSYFNETLSIQEQRILGDYLVLVWFKSVVQDVTQVNLRLQGRDKKNHAESSNLKEKKAYLVQLEERVRQKVVDYQFIDDNFNEIFNG